MLHNLRCHSLRFVSMCQFEVVISLFYESLFFQNNLLNSMGGGAVGAGGGNNPQLNALNSMQPLQVQKYLNQGPHNVGAAGPQTVNPAVAFGQGSNVAAVNAAAAAVSNSTNQPSTQQLRMLVQQIQLAVHSGYLSSQILNQPLAPTTLLLLNQLLSNIKVGRQSIICIISLSLCNVHSLNIHTNSIFKGPSNR